MMPKYLFAAACLAIAIAVVLAAYNTVSITGFATQRAQPAGGGVISAAGAVGIGTVLEGHTIPATSGKTSVFASDDAGSCKRKIPKDGTCNTGFNVPKCGKGINPVLQECCWPERPYASPARFCGCTGIGTPICCLGAIYGVDWYAAMRWPVSELRWWYNKKVLVTNPSNGKKVVLAILDWGPREDTGRVIDISYKAMYQALGAKTNDIVNIEFADQSAPLGPVA